MFCSYTVANQNPYTVKDTIHGLFHVDGKVGKSLLGRMEVKKKAIHCIKKCQVILIE
jgi:hypothetical protein